MTKIFQAVIWAAIMVVVALLVRKDSIDDGSATTLLIVIPLIAYMQISGCWGCRLGLGGRRA